MESTNDPTGWNPSVMAAQGPWTGVPGAYGIPGYGKAGAPPRPSPMGMPMMGAAPMMGPMPTMGPEPMMGPESMMGPMPMMGPEPMMGPMPMMAPTTGGPVGPAQGMMKAPGPTGAMSGRDLHGAFRVPGFAFNMYTPFLQGGMRWGGMQGGMSWPGFQAMGHMPGWQFGGKGPGMMGAPNPMDP